MALPFQMRRSSHQQNDQTASDRCHIVWGKVEVDLLGCGSCDMSEEERLLTTFMDNASQRDTDTGSSDDSAKISASLSQSTARTPLSTVGRTFCKADSVGTDRVGMLLRSSSPARLQEAPANDFSANPLAGSTRHEEEAARPWRPHAEVNGGRRFPTSSPEHVAGRPCL
eukprot:CAMPEP_0117485338 /NCGR_PEP_ID=MMETSP0784-20121206/14915_1 /TAXON_ID=39447 /ORGANISM="" /LENGTH=168 /DNA_ID=CAMNT_0005279925 /DNA_START=62 /DNA_END=564 /DNA_ORIENTATION=+